MNKISSLSLGLALVGAGVLSGCATHHPVAGVAMGAGPATTTVTTVTTPAPAVAAARTLSAADVHFIAVAAGAGMYEVEAGRLAASRATNPAVKSYAQMLVDHHTANNRELMALVQSKGQRVAPGLPPELQQKVARLQGLNGAEFDREFVKTTGVQDHTAAIAEFEKSRRSVADRDVQAFIDKTLPTLRSHLQQAQTIAGQILG